MNFTQALQALTEGNMVKRAGSPDVRWVRRIEPSVEPDVDGPEFMFRPFRADRPLGNEIFEKEEDATKFVKKLQKDHAAEWKKFTESEAAYNQTAPEERMEKKMVKANAPARHDGFYAELETRKVPASRFRCINVPFFIAMDRGSSISPYTFSHADVGATDWTLA